METIAVLALAVIIDLALGDPPNALHPVAWMGKVIALFEKSGLKLKPQGQFIYGIAMTLLITALFVAPAYFIIFYIWKANVFAGVVVSALIFKSTFSITGLRRAAQKIRNLLKEESLDKTRFELRALVSRNTSALSPSLMASAAVESVAEGTCDSMVAPILLILSAAFKKTGQKAWETARNEHARTESPNAGWTIAAAAGALDTRLEKIDHYTLRESGAAPNVTTIDSAVRLFLNASFIWVMLCLLAEVIIYAA
jgi:adenosylcobinamide-phosphate synthase